MAIYSRQATTSEEQISILENRGLIFEDRNLAIQNIENMGYFRFKGYCLSFYEKGKRDVFKQNTAFEKIFNIYRFDERFRILLFQMIEHIEVVYKSKIGYYFSLEYGALGHYKSVNFNDIRFHSDWMIKLDESINRASQRKERFLKNYKENYDNTFPIWVSLELTSMGNLSKFYNNLIPEFQNRIAKNICGYRREYLESWLYSISSIRNICAHGGRLYDRRVAITAKIDNKSSGIIDNTKIFSNIFILKNMCTDEQYWDRFQRNLQALIDIYADSLDLKKMGFPENWRSLLV
ncbi:TPA: Abi family protein [Listeria monocytogenes]